MLFIPDCYTESTTALPLQWFRLAAVWEPSATGTVSILDESTTHCLLSQPWSYYSCQMQIFFFFFFEECRQWMFIRVVFECSFRIYIIVQSWIEIVFFIHVFMLRNIILLVKEHLMFHYVLTSTLILIVKKYFPLHLNNLTSLTIYFKKVFTFILN